jgi:hypothetical protein
MRQGLEQLHEIAFVGKLLVAARLASHYRHRQGNTD